MKYRIHIENKSTLESRIILFYPLALIISIFICFGYILGSLDVHPNKIEKLVYSDAKLIDKYNPDFTEDRLFDLLKKLNVKHIDIVMVQSKIETTHYSSDVYLENNNLFGMKYPGNRVTLATGVNRGHATFDTWQDSVIDYAIWQSCYLRNKNREEYLDYLEKHYASNPKYRALIVQMMNDEQRKTL